MSIHEYPWESIDQESLPYDPSRAVLTPEGDDLTIELDLAKLDAGGYQIRINIHPFGGEGVLNQKPYENEVEARRKFEDAKEKLRQGKYSIEHLVRYHELRLKLED